MNILISAGELSGDMHAARLVRAIHESDPTIHFFGIVITLIICGILLLIEALIYLIGLKNN